MKKIVLLLLLVCTATYAQKREKIKGNKNVTLSQKELEPFDTIEIEDNIEAYLITAGAKPLEIEADDNLHEVIIAEVKGTTLRLYTNKEITGAKKIVARVTYQPAILKSISVKHEALLYALTDIAADTLAIKSTDYAKLFMNIKSKQLSLNMNDKTRGELNVKSGTANIELNKNAELKALISCTDLKLDMYQKTAASIEGDAATAVISLDNLCEFTGKRFGVKSMVFTTESYAKASIMVKEGLTMSASGKTQTELFGDPGKVMVTIKKFADNAVLSKKEDRDK